VRLAYYGTPALAVPPLRRLTEQGHAPLLVVTRPDRPKGRGLSVAPSAVKEAALSLGLPVATPARAGAPEELDRIRLLTPDLIVLAAYGQILPEALLRIPKLGALNLHYSLLPRHRGASPIQSAILAGDKETGVTAMWMTAGLDEGPVFFERRVPIDESEDAGALAARLAEVAADCVAEAMERIARGDIVRTEQDHARATFTAKMGPRDARLLPGDAPASLARRVRAFAPEPGAWLDVDGERLLVLAAEAGSATPPPAPPGTLLGIDKTRGVEIALPSGSLWIARVKPSGRKAMAAADYVNGRRLKKGDRLELGSDASSRAAHSGGEGVA
jgi:methionyl-tRNA formyltransferase